MTTSSSLILDSLPLGFRFRPTNEELVNHYLKNKLLGNTNDSVVNNVMAEVDVCKFEPWELPSYSVIKSDDPEWFFLCRRNYKYANCRKINRETKLGFWKATGNDIKINGSDKVIATKKILVYYQKATGSERAVKTNWVIHEYHDSVTFDDDKQRTHYLCHLIKNAEKKGEDENYTMLCDEGESSTRRLTTSFLPTLPLVPVGLRFCPTDEELVKHYLKNKILRNDSIANNVIAEIDVCKFEPCDLPARSLIKSDDPEWFFLCPLQYKYEKSKRINRTTKNGFWKATGRDRNIKIRGTNKVIGSKKILVYHEGLAPGVNTNWIIHEYHDATFDDSQRTFVLCRLMKKAVKNTEEEPDTMICGEGESSRHMSSNYENQETTEGISNVISGTLPEINMEFEEPYQADNDFPFSTQQSSIYENEPEVYFSNSQSQGAYYKYGDIAIRSPLEIIEEESNFLNSLFNDGDFVTRHKNGLL